MIPHMMLLLLDDESFGSIEGVGYAPGQTWYPPIARLSCQGISRVSAQGKDELSYQGTQRISGE